MMTRDTFSGVGRALKLALLLCFLTIRGVVGTSTTGAPEGSAATSRSSASGPIQASDRRRRAAAADSAKTTTSDAINDELVAKIREFLQHHGEALAAYRELLSSREQPTQRHLLSDSAETAFDSWVKATFGSLSSLASNGESLDGAEVVALLNQTLHESFEDAPSVAHLQQLLQTVLNELTYEQQNQAEAADITVWERLERAVNNLDDLQRRAALAQALLSAFEEYTRCRDAPETRPNLACYKDLVAALEGVVEQFDAAVYTAQSVEDATSSVLFSFRTEMADVIRQFRSCLDMDGIYRVNCMGQWWKAVQALQEKYGDLDESALSPADARLVALLKQMLSIEHYLLGTHPVVELTPGDSASTVPLSEAMDRAATLEETGVVASLREAVARFREFVQKFSLFERLRKREEETASVNRRLLAEEAGMEEIADYREELSSLLGALATLQEKGEGIEKRFGRERLLEALQFLLTARERDPQSVDDRRELRQHLHRAVVAAVNDGSTTAARRRLRTDTGLREQLSLLPPTNETAKLSPPELEQLFATKSRRSLADLTELRAMATRRLSRADPTSVEDLGDSNQPSGERGSDLEIEKAKLDDVVGRALWDGWRRVVEDMSDDVHRILKAATAIVAQDSHFHATADDGLPKELVELNRLDEGSARLLAEVGQTVMAFAKTKAAVKRPSLTNAPPRRQRSLLAAYPMQTNSYYGLDSAPQNSDDSTAAEGVSAEASAVSTLTPFLPGVSDATDVGRPEWWIGRTVAVPEAHHFEHDFDFGPFDEEAPVDKALGTLMKYHLLKDLEEEQIEEEHARQTLLQYFVLCVGLVMGLFLALLTLGVCLLKKVMDEKTLAEEAWLDDGEDASMPLIQSLDPGLKIKTGRV